MSTVYPSLYSMVRKEVKSSSYTRVVVSAMDDDNNLYRRKMMAPAVSSLGFMMTDIMTNRHFSTGRHMVTSCEKNHTGGTTDIKGETFYSKSDSDSDSDSDISGENVNEIISNLIDENSSSSTTTTTTIITSDDIIFSPSWYNPADKAVQLLNYVDSLHDLPYAYTIIGSTIFIRTLLFPLFVYVKRNASRMAHMTPELNVLKERVEKLGKNASLEQQTKYANEMRALFRKYDCNPVKNLIAPAVQLPVFMSMFFALQKLPIYYADTLLSNGGIFWFPDLAAPDPLYVLPMLSSLTFIASMELNKQEMQSISSSTVMTYVFRFLGVLTFPITIYFPSCVLSYWVTNNAFTLAQTAILQLPVTKRTFGIWEPPKRVVGAPEPKGIQEMITDYMNKKNEEGSLKAQKDSIRKHNEAIDNQKMEMNMKARSQQQYQGRKRKNKKRGRK